jgi:hypothetical protein
VNSHYWGKKARREISEPTILNLLARVSVVSVADTDPGYGAFLTSGSRLRDGKKKSGSGITDEHSGIISESFGKNFSVKNT